LASAAGPESRHVVNRSLAILLAVLGCALAPERAAAQDLCAFLAKHGPAVFGTPLQAAAQCDRQGDLTNSGAANNATGSDRLEISMANVPGVEAILDGVRRETREGRVISDEPSLGKGAILERSDKGRLATSPSSPAAGTCGSTSAPETA
jgi:hypothetical protein